MYHRIIGNLHTGLGNPNEPLLNNEWSGNEEIDDLAKKIFDDGIEEFFKEIGTVDFHIEVTRDEIIIAFGIEPTYQYDSLKILCISSNINNCKYINGKANGAYGTNISKKIRPYKNYKIKCKFTRFIEKWNSEIKKIKGEI